MDTFIHSPPIRLDINLSKPTQQSIHHPTQSRLFSDVLSTVWLNMWSTIKCSHALQSLNDWLVSGNACHSVLESFTALTERLYSTRCRVMSRRCSQFWNIWLFQGWSMSYHLPFVLPDLSRFLDWWVSFMVSTFVYLTHTQKTSTQISVPKYLFCLIINNVSHSFDFWDSYTSI